MLSREQKTIKSMFKRLVRAPIKMFPEPQGSLDAPDRQGVYLIYDSKKRVVHVGRTPRGRRGLHQRLCNHLHGASSFTIHYLKGKGSKLRSKFTYRYLVVRDPRKRALLEAYATGQLCPLHLGLNQK